jgi:multiple sugar transport system substrate-binding protein
MLRHAGWGGGDRAVSKSWKAPRWIGTRERSAAHAAIAVSVATVMVVAVACGGDGGEQGAGEATKLTVAAVAGTESEPLKAILPDYEKETGVEIDLVELPYPNLFEKLQTNLSSESDAYDVAFMDDPWLPAFAGGGYLVPLQDLGYKGDDEDFARASIDIGKWPTPGSPEVPNTEGGEPTQYAIPIVGNAQMYNYREDLLDKKRLAPPKTWDDVLKIAKSFQGSGTFGFVARAATGNPIVTNFSPVLRGYGGDYFDDSWQVIVNDGSGVAALERYVQLTKFSPPGVANFDADQLNQTLLDGKGVQAANWPAWAPVLEGPDSKVAGDIGYSVTPAQPGEKPGPTLGNWLLGIPTGSAYQEDAFDFITWATSEESFRKMLEASDGAVPPRLSLLQDPALAKQFPWFPALADSLEVARFRPRIPNWNEIEEILGRHLNEAVTGTAEPQEALDAAAEEMASAMKRAGITDG